MIRWACLVYRYPRHLHPTGGEGVRTPDAAVRELLWPSYRCVVERKKGWKCMTQRIQQLPDWMYHAIEESFTCQFVSVTESGTPVALPLFLSYFDPDTGTL